MVTVLRQMAESMTKMAKKRQAGFSTLELMVVIAMSLIITAIAIPSYLNVSASLRVAGDLRELNGLVSQAKMRAAADFTHARAYVDLTGNTFHLEVWNKSGNSGAGCWKTDNDVVNACTQTSSPVTALAQGDTWGFGNTVTAGPTAAQSTISQAPGCTPGVAGGSAGSAKANTACIEFNSRGNPVNSAGALTAVGALYLGNNVSIEAVTVSATGLIQTWSTSTAGTGSSWTHQ
jgi:Tfp pilus assembly protein FimT